MPELRVPTVLSRVETIAKGMGLERVGFDAVHIPTWRRCLEVGGDALLRRTYTAAEVAFCRTEIDRLAARFAAKEAILKVLGTGLTGVGMNEVEVVTEPSGRPGVRLHCNAQSIAESLRLRDFQLSLCHEVEYAFAIATARQEGASR